MRFLLGLIVGVGVAVGAAYVHDSAIRAPDRPAIVNWTALDSALRIVRDDIASGWDRISSAARS